jgi:Pro-kumamolisin, activation domain/Bacterial Ig-like domain (group 3)
MASPGKPIAAGSDPDERVCPMAEISRRTLMLLVYARCTDGGKVLLPAADFSGPQSPRPFARLRALPAFFAALYFLGALPPASAQADGAAKYIGRQTPPQVLDGTAKLAGHYGPSQMLRVVLGLKPPHLAEEEAFLVRLHTPGSKDFHAFLTAAQWNDRFAPSAADEQKVVDWAQGQGLTVTGRFPNRLVVDLEAPAGIIEKAFGVTINRYQVGDALEFSNDREPVLPPGLAGLVSSVQGLNSIQRMHSSTSGGGARGPDYSPGPVIAEGPSMHRDGNGTGPPASHDDPRSNITNGFIDPSDIYSAQAYDYAALAHIGHCCNPNNKASGSPVDSSIAIVTAGSYDPNDFTGFLNQYPYLAAFHHVFTVDGAPTCCQLETTMDLEWSTATSNSFGSYLDTAQVYVYEGANSSDATFTDIYNGILNEEYAKVVSISWGSSEVFGEPTTDMDTQHAIFNQMIGEGWTIVASSGDHGAAGDCDIDNPAHTGVIFPGSDPNVVSAGGTSLALNADGTYNAETAWQGGSAAGSCKQNDGGSTGGTSRYYPIPLYQSASGLGGLYRQVPDIALNASSGQNIFFQGKLQPGGGTSIVAPELAGFFAQENAYLTHLGNTLGTTCGIGQACAPMGNANYYIYGVASKNPNPTHYPFYDIFTGCNSNDATVAGSLIFYCAHGGYDEVTGWGSANMLQLAWGINFALAGDGGPPYALFHGPVLQSWYNTSEKVGWTINDSTLSQRIANGVAGFTALWDQDPGDGSNGATPGGTNSFYTGPAVAATSGSKFLATAGGQGCHTVHLRAWDNAGQGSGDMTYGPICYDTIPPVSTISTLTAPNADYWFDHPVQVTLNATDPGMSAGTASGAYLTYNSVDNPHCLPANPAACAVYVTPLTLSTDGMHHVRYFSNDYAGNIENLQLLAINIDQIPPSTTARLIGLKEPSTNIFIGPVGVELERTDALSGVATTVYQIGNAAVQPYTKPLSIDNPGTTKITFHSTDKAGNVEPTRTVSIADRLITIRTFRTSANPVKAKTNVTFTAAVIKNRSFAAPTGRFKFYVDGVYQGYAQLSAAGVATRNISFAAGTHLVRAFYSGDSIYGSTQTPIITEIVK